MQRLLTGIASFGVAFFVYDAKAAEMPVSSDEYLDLVEAAVASYPDDHVAEYIADADANGVNEHGFPRLTANIAALISSGRQCGRRDLFRRMMDICCRDAKKGMMKKEGNEFSVKELVAALVDVERAGLFPRDVTDGWRRDLAEVDPWRCYRVKPEIGDTKVSYNWCVFGAASEQTRISSGVGGDAEFVERYVSDQIRWFDDNGMWRDPHEPAVYDLVTRLQFALVLSTGYSGLSRAKLEALLDRGAAMTLELQSAAGEIPYGGRSNQFLHNDTLYSALCEWYAARAMERGEAETAARFFLGARRAVDSVKGWLAARPVRHVKNRYPRGSGKRGTGIGCEGYAYFDKYMITMGSWAILARRFAFEMASPRVLRARNQARPVSPCSKPHAFETSPFFHFVFLNAGDYSAQFDYNSDSRYDCDGMGRLHRRGAPTAICISTPCALNPNYSTERPNGRTLAFAPAGDGALMPAGSGSDAESAWANWRQGALDWKCRLTAEGLSSELFGPGEVVMTLPAFEFDGEASTEVSCDGKSLAIRYRGWVCRYATDGTIVDTGAVCCNHNGRYRVFEARGTKSVSVKVVIFPECAVPGPGTSVVDFFGRYVDCTIPALRGIPAKMAAGDTNAANRIFADYVRATLDSRKVNAGWYDGDLTASERAALRKNAEEIMDYRLSACGVPYHFRDHRIDWTFNPTYNGYKEWPWQFGRQPFFTTLASYYVRLGHDERAAKTWRDMVSGWIEQAPPPPDGTPPWSPVTWRTLDAGLRVAGWCSQMCAFARSPSLSDEFIVRFFRSVRDHGHRLEKPMTTNNWRIMELNGLLHVAMLFPFLSESRTWRDGAIAEFKKQLDLQLYPDGFQFELSPGYHGVIPHNYGNILELFGVCGETPPSFVLNGIESAYDMYPHIARPDRTLPPLNDSREVALGPEMEKAAKLYPGREDFRWFATDGAEGRAPDYLSCAFPYAGAVVFRSSWARDAVWGYMDCSPFGRGHQHEDKLNVLMSAYGKNMIVEPGNYAYDTSDMRRYVISTRAHNTILVDGREQFTRRGFKWNPEDISKKADFRSGIGGDVEFAHAAFNAGYGFSADASSAYFRKQGAHVPPSDMTVHSRTLIFFRKIPGLGPFFVVVDRLVAPDDRKRTYDSLWHLEECGLKIDGSGFVADFGGGVGLAAAFSDSEATIVDMKGSHEPYQGWMPIWPPGPHEHRPIPTPVLKGRFAKSKRIVGVFYPYCGDANRLIGVRASPDVGANGFTLLLADGAELELGEGIGQDVK